uniref:Leucine-rich repeat-containing N-terminal plant-type domain-containing protein n=1 Tax=Arundo donax TaxID=35708 RepID=A0A0A9EG47_ARUDO
MDNHLTSPYTSYFHSFNTSMDNHLTSPYTSYFHSFNTSMDNHLRSPFIVLLLCCVAATVAHPARCVLLSHERKHSVSSYKPQPLDFPNEQLYRAYLVIQRFKSTVTSDPKNITATWTGHDLCGETTYVGFYCGSTPGESKKLTVTGVILNGYSLHAPTLHGFVDQLPDLALFHAASNNFGGDIPRVAGLGYMYELNVNNDIPLQTLGRRDPGRAEQWSAGGGTNPSLTGDCINAFINFTFHLGVPRGKGGHYSPGVTDGKALLLNHNNLSGPLPVNIGFSKLSYLALANNKLTGSIPPSIGHLQDSLLEVLLLNNQLSGCLPHELGMLTKAAVIDAGMNQLTGPIPSSFSCLSSVEQLNLAGNRLYGDLPDALCKLAGPAGRLTNLTLSGNYFTSVGPSCVALIKDGVLDVKNNCIPGLANQRRPAECASFLSQPKMCPAASAQLSCSATAAENAAAPGERKGRDYSSYVTYATLHE